MSGSYTKITLDEFVDFLDEHTTYTQAETNDKEYVFDIPLPVEDKTVRVFSSIDKRTDTSRESGADAIRTVLWDHEINAPVGGRKRTHRIETWRDNLLPKIADLMVSWRDYEHSCSECGATMVQRESDYGVFFGCSRYPECSNTFNP